LNGLILNSKEQVNPLHKEGRLTKITAIAPNPMATQHKEVNYHLDLELWKTINNIDPGSFLQH
jgi:hypothetical protein